MNAAELIALLDRHANDYMAAGDPARAAEMAEAARSIAALARTEAHTRGAIKLLFCALQDEGVPKKRRIAEIRRLYPDVPDNIIDHIVNCRDHAAETEFTTWCANIKDFNLQQVAGRS